MSVVVFHFGVAFWTFQEAAAALARRGPLYPGETGVPRSADLLRGLPVDLGALGVGLFFVLSGFVIGISLDRYNRRGFVVGRLMRVLPTYAAGYLVLCGVAAVGGDPLHELHVGNVLAGMVPGLYLLLGVPAPADGVVWTLIIEFVFYGVCLIGHRTLTRRWQAIAGVALACIVIQHFVPGPAVIPGSSVGGALFILLLAVPFLPVMLIGLTLSSRSRGHLSAPASGLLVLGLTLTHVWLTLTTTVVPLTLLYRETFIGVIVIFCVVWKVGANWGTLAATDFVAGISFPLYVVHQALGYALLSVLVGHGVRPVLAMPAVVAVVVVLAWVLHRLVEMPTHRLGQRWSRRLSPAPAPLAAPEPVDEPVAHRAPLHEEAAVGRPRVSAPAAPLTRPMAAVGDRAKPL
jgi:peptidoglycan/LPS O-acetylase OafA/YrhL